MKYIRSYRGTTLVEMLIVLAIFVLISAFFVGMTLQFSKLYQLGEAQFLTVGNARVVLGSMAAYVPQAKQLVANHTVGGTTYITGSSTLVLQLPAINNSGDIISNTWDYVVFYKSSSTVYRVVSADAASSRVSGSRALGNTITDFELTYNNVSTTLATQVFVGIRTNLQSGHVSTTNYETTTYILRNF